MERELEVGKTYLVFSVDKGRVGTARRNPMKKFVGSNRGRYYVVSRSRYEYVVRFCGTPAENVDVMNSIAVADLICGYVCAYRDGSGSLDPIAIPHTAGAE